MTTQSGVGGLRMVWRLLAHRYLWPGYYAALARGDRHKARVRALEEELDALRGRHASIQGLQVVEDIPDDEPTDPQAGSLSRVADTSVERAPVSDHCAVLTSFPILPTTVAYRETAQPDASVFRLWELPHVFRGGRYIVDITLKEVDGEIVKELWIQVQQTPSSLSKSPSFLTIVAEDAAKTAFYGLAKHTERPWAVPFAVAAEGTPYLVNGKDDWKVWINSEKITKTWRDTALFKA